MDTKENIKNLISNSGNISPELKGKLDAVVNDESLEEIDMYTELELLLGKEVIRLKGKRQEAAQEFKQKQEQLLTALDGLEKQLVDAKVENVDNYYAKMDEIYQGDKAATA
ncbi:hypothetical protein ACFL2B_00340 [Patescibacteria group bacterium]